MADAEDTAATAESTAITNYEDQEAVVNALLVIEGCAQTTYADLGWDGTEETADPENSANAEAAELTLYEDATGCCGTRMTTFLALTSGTECTTNTGWGMQGERVIRNTEETTDESTYTSTCTTTSATCDGTTDYTNYRDAKLAVMKATRMMAIVDDACTDWVTGSTDATSFTYDCSNGYLSNS